MQFTNELGNEITISVEEQEVAGVPGILMKLTGPTSESTNHITKKEAEILYQELSKALFH